jgi:uncharacterized membrane protein YidH (DUF202 family)
VMAGTAPARWRAVQEAMHTGREIPVGRGLTLLGTGLALYAVIALAAVALD